MGGGGGQFGTIKSGLSECSSDLILIGASTVQYHHQLESDNTDPINVAVARLSFITLLQNICGRALKSECGCKAM